MRAIAYVDDNYYRNDFGGELDGSVNLHRLLDEASIQVDRMTYGRIRRRGFENLTEYQQELIKKAVCYQAEFIHDYGEYLNMPVDGYSAGDISLTFSKDNRGAGGVIADKRTLDHLAQTGLTVRRL